MYLFVGDPHVTPDSLDECLKLFEFVFAEACKIKVLSGSVRIVFMGDMHHTHAIIRVEVLHFLRHWLGKFAAEFGKENVIVLVGNHDMPGNAGMHREIHALLSYKDLVTIVDSPYIYDKVGYMPYYHDPVQFIKDANSLGCKTLICHQTFVGAKFDNNFPAPDGVDINQMVPTKMICGHLHTIQDLGRVQYLGSPRWITASDANKERGIWIADNDFNFSFLSTEEVCRNILSFDITPMNLEQFQNRTFDSTKNKKIIVTLTGPKEWVKEAVKTMQPIAKFGELVLKAVYVGDKEIAIKESEGLSVSLKKYVDSKKWDVSKEILWKEIMNRVTWLSKI